MTNGYQITATLRLPQMDPSKPPRFDSAPLAFEQDGGATIASLARDPGVAFTTLSLKRAQAACRWMRTRKDWRGWTFGVSAA